MTANADGRDGFGVGLPFFDASTPVVEAAGTAAAPQVVSESPLRDGETGLGLPHFEAGPGQKLSSEERRQLSVASDILERERLEAEIGRRLSWGGNFATGLARKLLLAGILPLAIGLTALLAIVLIAESSQIYANLQSLPQALRIGGLGLVFLLSIAVFTPVVTFARLYVTLQASRRRNLSMLRAIEERSELRRLCRSEYARARKDLIMYLNAYDPKRMSAVLERLQMPEEDQRALFVVREQLLDPNRFGGSEEWLSRFENDFQKPLDQIVESRINRYAVQVGLKTASCPWPIGDAAITFHAIFCAMTDAALAYNLRLGAQDTLLILTAVIAQTYSAAQSDAWSIDAARAIGLDDLAQHAQDLFGVAGVEILKKAGPKIASGTANGLMLRRVAQAGAGMMKPLS